MNQHERRYKIIYISQELFLDVLNAIYNRQVIELPVYEEIPPDCEVVRIHEDFATGNWAMVLYHPSFPSAPEGCHIRVIQHFGNELFKRIPVGDLFTCNDQRISEKYSRQQVVPAERPPEHVIPAGTAMYWGPDGKPAPDSK